MSGKVNIAIVRAWWKHQPPEWKYELLTKAGLHPNDRQSKAFGATYSDWEKLDPFVQQQLIRTHWPDGVQ